MAVGVTDIVFEFCRNKILVMPLERCINPCVWRATERVMYQDFCRWRQGVKNVSRLSRQEFAKGMAVLFPYCEVDLDWDGEVIWCGMRYFCSGVDDQDLAFLKRSYKPFVTEEAP